MKKIIKKTIATALCVIMMLGIAPLNGFVGLEFPDINIPQLNIHLPKITLPDFSALFATKVNAEGATSGTFSNDKLKWNYNKSNGVLTISGNGNMIVYGVVYNNIPWKEYRNEIQTVYISTGVTSICTCAFMNCSALTNITIPNSVTSIGISAFSGCSSLARIIIPDSVISIENNAFSGCSSLVNITFPESITSISNHTLSNCTNLTNVIISESVTSIGDYAFRGCEGLTNIAIPDSVTSIGNYSFCECFRLKSIRIPDSVDYIGSYAFSDCSSLTSAIIGFGVSNIEEKSFYNCEMLKTISILSERITHIGHWAFYNSGYYNTATNWTLYNSSTNLTDNKVLYIDNYLIEAKESLKGKIVLRSSTKGIADYAFSGCSGLTNITIPEGVSAIGKFTFSNCYGLTNIVIPDSVTSIGNHAFNGCSGLTKITMSDSVNSIIDSAFNRCDNVADIFYIGTKESWDNISIDVNNSVLQNATDYINYDGDTSHAWIHFSKDYLIKYYDGEELINSVTIKNLKKIPDYFLQKTGYTFIGWQWSTEDGSKPTVMPEEDLTATAQWQVNYYTVSFNTNTSEEIEPLTLAYGTAVPAIDDPVREGYTFSGWNPAILETMPDEDVTLTAIWIKNQSVIFDTDGGTEIPTFSAAPGTTVPAVADPVKEGYTFTGWVPAIPENIPDEDITITAVWRVNQYNLTYLDVDGSVLKSEKKDYGSAISVYTPIKTGYTFLGWNENAPQKMPANDLTFTAVGWRINKHTISFDSAGGTPVNSITADYGSTVNIPDNPTRIGYTFAGWDTPIPATMPDKNISAKAVWNINTYTIRFNTNGGTSVGQITKPYGSNVAKPQNPSKNGYTFVGWDSEIPTTMPAYDITVNALWKPTGHEHETELINSVAPTCTEDGKSGYTFCPTCNRIIDYGYNIPALGHSYSETVKKNPGCVEKGITLHICNRCSDSYTSDIEPLGHSYTSSIKTQPTCTEEGVKLFVCSRCSDNYTESIPANGHTKSYSRIIIEPTCTEKGTVEITCFCGHKWTEPVEPNGHNYSKTVTKAPTCTEKGEMKYSCLNCDYCYTDSINATGHDYNSTVHQPTCTAKGYTTYKCKNCSHTYNDNYTNAVGHNFSINIDVKVSTCKDHGYYVKKCSRCGNYEGSATNTQNDAKKYELPLENHNYKSEITKYPTYEEEGVRKYTCSVCGKSYTEAIPRKTGTFVVTFEAGEGYWIDEHMRQVKTITRRYQVGQRIELPPTPERYNSNWVFVGWSEHPSTMPDHSITITAQFRQLNGFERFLKSIAGFFNFWVIVYPSIIGWISRMFA